MDGTARYTTYSRIGPIGTARDTVSGMRTVMFQSSELRTAGHTVPNCSELEIQKRQFLQWTSLDSMGQQRTLFLS